jgi:hypothetical protein
MTLTRRARTLRSIAFNGNNRKLKSEDRDGPELPVHPAVLHEPGRQEPTKFELRGLAPSGHFTEWR